MCLYAALRTFAPTPVVHQRLIDLAMALKDSGILPEVESVSKTKVRGVLAILKQAEFVGKCGELGEAVQLYLTEEMDSFGKLRERHDKFLQAYMVENLLHVPEELLGEMVWQVSAEEKQRRLAYLDGLTRQLEELAVNLIGNDDDEKFMFEKESHGNHNRSRTDTNIFFSSNGSSS